MTSPDNGNDRQTTPEEFVRDAVRSVIESRQMQHRSAGPGHSLASPDPRLVPDWASERIALERPLAVIDLEATGTAPHRDRVVEISVLKIFPNGTKILRHRRLNPGMPIPPEATEIH